MVDRYESYADACQEEGVCACGNLACRCPYCHTVTRKHAADCENAPAPMDEAELSALEQAYYDIQRDASLTLAEFLRQCGVSDEHIREYLGCAELDEDAAEPLEFGASDAFTQAPI